MIEISNYLFNIITMDKKTSLKIGLVLGAVLGGLATLFLSPRSGKENRELAAKKLEELKILLKDKNIDEIVKEIYGKVTDEGKKLYVKARDDISAKLAEMQDVLGEIDREKYADLVKDVMERLQKEKEVAKDHVEKLQTYFMNRWSMAQKMAEEDAKKMMSKKSN